MGLSARPGGPATPGLQLYLSMYDQPDLVTSPWSLMAPHGEFRGLLFSGSQDQDRRALRLHWQRAQVGDFGW
jgi:hypothetical protein